MKKVCMFFACALFLMLTGCKKDVLYATDSGKTITYAVGDKFSVRLQENSSTGYTWRFKTMPESQLAISLVSDYFEAPKTNRVGAGGEHIFIWQAVGVGSVEIQGFHARPWARTQDEPSVSYKIIVK